MLQTCVSETTRCCLEIRQAPTRWTVEPEIWSLWQLAKLSKNGLNCESQNSPGFFVVVVAVKSAMLLEIGTITRAKFKFHLATIT